MATRPEKLKRHICVCPERRLFLRINSESLWKPNFKLEASLCRGMIEYDSFVELKNLYLHPRAFMKRDWERPENPLGRLSEQVAFNIALAAGRADTLTEEQQSVIWENLAKL